MPFSTNAALQDFEASLANCISFTPTGSLDLADGAYSSSIAVTETEIDNSTAKAPLVRLVLKPMDGWTGTIASGGSVSIYFQETETDGTNDSPEPDSSNENKFRGSFGIDVNHGTEPVSEVCSCLGIKKFKVFIRNDTGASASLDDDNTNGWSVQYELMSFAPKAA